MCIIIQTLGCDVEAYTVWTNGLKTKLVFVKAMSGVERSKAPRALSLQIVAECSTTKARTSKLCLPHYTVDTPVFMPVGTQGTMKGLTTSQLETLDCQLILGNTYHLGMRPVRSSTTSTLNSSLQDFIPRLHFKLNCKQ